MLLDLAVPAGLDPYVAGVVSTLTFARPRMLKVLEGLTPEQLMATAPGFANSLSSLALHVAGYEIVCAHRISGTPVPAELKPDFLLDRQGTVPVAEGETADSLTAKLERSRAHLLAELAKLTAADLEREFGMGPERTGTVRWVLGLLPYHQSEHLGQMILLRKLVAQA